MLSPYIPEQTLHKVGKCGRLSIPVWYKQYTIKVFMALHSKAASGQGEHPVVVYMNKNSPP